MKGVFKKLGPQEISIKPFKAYKSWGFTNSADLESAGIERLVAIKPDYTKYAGGVVTLDTTQTINDTGSYLVNLDNNLPASVMWYSINHLYYKNAQNPYDTFGNPDPNSIQRTLYTEASIYSIPQNLLGEGLRPGTVTVTCTPTATGTTINLLDDGNGNLIDTSLSESISNQSLYLRFNEMTYESSWSPVSNVYTSSIQDIKFSSTNKEIAIKSQNVLITPNDNKSWGNVANFYNTGYIRIPNSDIVNFKQDDSFTISFWYSTSSTGTTKEYIVSKRTTAKLDVKTSLGTIQTTDRNLNKVQHPIEIYYYGGQIFASQCNGATTSLVNAVVINDSTRHHYAVVCSNKTLQLYIDGTLVSTSITLPEGNIHNNADFFIGSLGLDVNGNANYGMSGTVDEFIIFNKSCSATEVLQLAFNTGLNLMTTNTNIVGNVFYEHGIVVISDPRPKYGTNTWRLFNSSVINTNTNTVNPEALSSFDLTFNSTVTIQEYEYLCRLNSDEFNLTLNPTIRNNDDINSDVPKDFVSNSDFSPYVTTIGLYTSNGELVAISKLANPVKKRDNIDLSIVVRFDA